MGHPDGGEKNFVWAELFGSKLQPKQDRKRYIRMEDTMSARTIFLSKLIGIYLVLAALSMAVHKQATTETMITLVQDSPLMFVVGIMTLAAGLAMVLGHNIWSGGALPIVVTIVGWLTLAKGLLFLLLSPEAAGGFYLGTLRYTHCFYVYMAIVLVLGVYLIYGGFRASEQK
jgi:hypothetical protein